MRKKLTTPDVEARVENVVADINAALAEAHTAIAVHGEVFTNEYGSWPTSSARLNAAASKLRVCAQRFIELSMDLATDYHRAKDMEK